MAGNFKLVRSNCATKLILTEKMGEEERADKIAHYSATLLTYLKSIDDSNDAHLKPQLGSIKWWSNEVISNLITLQLLDEDSTETSRPQSEFKNKASQEREKRVEALKKKRDREYDDEAKAIERLEKEDIQREKALKSMDDIFQVLKQVASPIPSTTSVSSVSSQAHSFSSHANVLNSPIPSVSNSFLSDSLLPSHEGELKTPIEDLKDTKYDVEQIKDQIKSFEFQFTDHNKGMNWTHTLLKEINVKLNKK